MTNGAESYIRQCRDAGFSRADVERALQGGGWKASDYEAALESAYGEGTQRHEMKERPENSLILPPLREYLEMPAGRWPPRRILEAECSKTYAPVQPAWRLVRGLGLLALAILFLFGSLFSWAMLGPVGILGLLILLGPLALAEAIETKEVLATYRFSLQPGFVFIRAGVINPHYHLLPYENVQDAQIEQGVLERVFGVASVIVSTPASQARIPFLKIQDAQTFSRDVLAMARAHKGLSE